MRCEGDAYYTSNQIQASFFAVKKSDFSDKIIKEWLNYCEDKECLLDDMQVQENKEYNFIEHRYDQSILSLLSKINNITPHQDPSQYGRVPELYSHNDAEFKRPDNIGEYKPFIILHRKNRIIKKEIIKMWMYACAPLVVLKMCSNRYRKAIGRTSTGKQ